MNLNDVGKKRGFNRIPQEIKEKVEAERSAEIDQTIQYTPKLSPNDYRAMASKMQEDAVKKSETEKEHEKKISEEEQRSIKRNRLKEKVAKEYPDVLDLIQAVKDRSLFSSGWDTMQVHAIGFLLVDGFNKLDRSLNLILNQLENNNATIADLLEVTKSMRNEIESMGIKTIRSDAIKTERPASIVVDDPDNIPAPEQGDHTGETIAKDETAPLPELSDHEKELQKFTQPHEDNSFPKKRKGMPKGGWPKKVKK